MNAVKPTFKWLYLLAIPPILLGIVAFFGWSWWSQETAPPLVDAQSNSTPGKTVQIQIPQGTASQQIGRQLENAGLIRSTQAWKLWTSWLSFNNKQGGFKSGVYRLSPTQSLPEIADQIWNGKVVQLDYTIPEGWSLQQMANYFESIGFFKAEDFLAATRDIPKEQFSWLPDNLPHLEGFLYPDTYKIASDSITPKLIVRQMLKEFERVALPVYQQAQSSTNFSLLEWVTLGSIVEKEAVIAEERPRIAGVFTARLKQGITLGSDPTVEYGLGIKQTKDQPLTYAQVKIPSPYNTYINPGLPPGPIASPGLSSLKAVLNPENTDYLYFVARYDGTHIFSRTLREHNAAIAAVRQQQSR
ncbi:MAG TPA: endolytic transglycosylase MltG [Oculatellaceae cyanobacterium]|jgi:UPF0755 protein